MRVLHVISGIDPENGGPSAALQGLAEAQVCEGLDVTVVATWQRPSAPAVACQWRKLGMTVEIIGPARGALSRHPSLNQTVERLVAAADVVHVHALWEEIQHQAARAAQRLDRPYIIRPCGGLHPWSLARSRWRKRAYLAWRLRANLDCAAAIHYTTEDERRAAEPLGLQAPAIVEPNGVRLTEFEQMPPAGTFRRGLGPLAERPIVLFLGRIHPKKGLEVLVDAFAEANLPEAMLVIAGPDSGGYRATIERQIERLGVHGRVHFTGMLAGAERVAALADADLFVLSSYTENFGVAVIEALAAGTSVIVSDQVGIHREIAAAGVGAVVPVDAGGLASELRRWMRDPALRAHAAGRAPAFVRERYDWQAIARAWREHYESLLRKARSAALANGA